MTGWAEARGALGAARFSSLTPHPSAGADLDRPWFFAGGVAAPGRAGRCLGRGYGVGGGWGCCLAPAAPGTPPPRERPRVHSAQGHPDPSAGLTLTGFRCPVHALFLCLCV